MAKFSYRITKTDTMKRKGHIPLGPTENLTAGIFESATMQTAEAHFETIISEHLPTETELTPYRYEGNGLLHAKRYGTAPDGKGNGVNRGSCYFGYRYIITLLVIEP